MRLGVMAGLAGALLAGCGGIGQEPAHVDVSISELRLGDATVLEQTWDMVLRIQNPNNYDIPADGLKFQVEVNGKPFARGVNNQQVSIPRLGEAMVPVKAVSDLPALMQQIGDLRRLGQQGLDYRLHGTVFSGGRRYPFEYNGSIQPLP